MVCVISFVWDIGICDSKGCLMFSGFWFMIVEVRVYACLIEWSMEFFFVIYFLLCLFV